MVLWSDYNMSTGCVTFIRIRRMFIYLVATSTVNRTMLRSSYGNVTNLYSPTLLDTFASPGVFILTTTVINIQLNYIHLCHLIALPFKVKAGLSSVSKRVKQDVSMDRAGCGQLSPSLSSFISQKSSPLAHSI